MRRVYMDRFEFPVEGPRWSDLAAALRDTFGVGWDGSTYPIWDGATGKQIRSCAHFDLRRGNLRLEHTLQTPHVDVQFTGDFRTLLRVRAMLVQIGGTPTMTDAQWRRRRRGHFFDLALRMAALAMVLAACIALIARYGCWMALLLGVLFAIGSIAALAAWARALRTRK